MKFKESFKINISTISIINMFFMYIIVLVLFHNNCNKFYWTYSFLDPLIFQSYRWTFLFFFSLSFCIAIIGMIVRNVLFSFIVLMVATYFCALSNFVVVGDYPIVLLSILCLVVAGGSSSRFPYNSIIVFLITTEFLFILNCNALTITTSQFVHNQSFPSWLDQITFFSISIIVGLLTSLLSYLQHERRNVQVVLANERQSVKQLTSFNQQLQNIAKDVEQVSIEKERNRITREMHDSNGYAFTNIIALANAAMSNKKEENWIITEELLQTIIAQAQEGLRESRTTLRKLRQVGLAEAPILANTLFSITQIFQKCTGITIEISYGNILDSYGLQLDKAIARIVQEALTNAARHGHASVVNIQLWETQNHYLQLFIEDNGVGSAQIVKGIGLKGMEERIHELNGTIKIQSVPSQGFKIDILVPLVSDDKD